MISTHLRPGRELESYISKANLPQRQIENTSTRRRAQCMGSSKCCSSGGRYKIGRFVEESPAHCFKPTIVTPPVKDKLEGCCASPSVSRCVWGVIVRLTTAFVNLCGWAGGGALAAREPLIQCRSEAAETEIPSQSQAETRSRQNRTGVAPSFRQMESQWHNTIRFTSTGHS